MKIEEKNVPLSGILAECKGIKVINNITCFSYLNRKTEALCCYCSGFRNMMFAETADYKRFSDAIRKKVDDLNKKFPKSRAFEVYSETKEWLHICVEDSPDKSVVRFSFTNVARVYQPKEE